MMPVDLHIHAGKSFMQVFSRRRALVWVVPPISTGVYYLLISWFSRGLFSQRLDPVAEPLDFAVQVLIGYALFCISRRVWAFLLVQGLWMALLYIGNAIMIRFFERPIGPSDTGAFGALVKVLPPIQLAYLVVPLALLVGLLIWNLPLRPWRWLAFCILIGAPLGTIAAYPSQYAVLVDNYRNVGYKSWNQLHDYRTRGPVLYFLETAARIKLAKSPPPTQEEVNAALQASGAAFADSSTTAPAIAKKRNVHIILVESFWDPAALSVAHLKQSPWPKGLEKLWAETGYSRALSPVFGHATANAEFEVLCGVPVLDDDIVFVSELTRPLPCLPRFLARHGYITAAEHPNTMNFWSRFSAYRYLGFERYYSKKDFVLDKLDHAFLSDESLLPQATQHIDELAGSKPYLNYVMTLASHYPYRLNHKLHPNVISSDYPDDIVEANVNSIHYTAEALLAHIRHLRANDPTGIIVIAGDHLPSYGRLDVYVDSKLFPRNLADASPAEMATRQGTPLIVINGRAGPVKIGAIPMYELPGLVLHMLGYKAPTVFNLFNATQEHVRFRPVEGLTLVVKDGAPLTVCHNGIDTHACKAADAWRERVRTLSADLLSGGQYALSRVKGRGYSLTLPKTNFSYIPSSAPGPCRLDVVAWGPKSMPAGNTIPDGTGDHSFWVKMKYASSAIKLQFDGTILPTWRTTGHLSGKVAALSSFDAPGKHSLDAVCRYAPGVVHIGTFTVHG